MLFIDHLRRHAKYWTTMEFFYIKMSTRHFRFVGSCGRDITIWSLFLMESLDLSCASLCVCLCPLVHVCVHAYACMCMWKTDNNLIGHSSNGVHLFCCFETVLSLTLNSPSRLGCLASNPQRNVSPSIEQAQSTMLGIFSWVLGVELMS